MSASNHTRVCFARRCSIGQIWPFLLGLCVILGCAKTNLPALILDVRLASVQTNANGEAIIQLSLTNNSASAILVGVRSAVYQTRGSWTTNYSVNPRFIGVAGPASEASDVTLNANQGISVALSPVRLPHPFHLEFLCFRSRMGVSGVIDNAKDKVTEFKDGSRHESYLGESIIVLGPEIDPTRGHVSIKDSSAHTKTNK